MFNQTLSDRQSIAPRFQCVTNCLINCRLLSFKNLCYWEDCLGHYFLLSQIWASHHWIAWSCRCLPWSQTDRRWWQRLWATYLPHLASPAITTRRRWASFPDCQKCLNAP